MSIASTSSTAGFTNDGFDSAPKFVQGTKVMAGGTVYTYAKAAANIAAAGTVALTGAFGATTTTTGTTHTHDVAVTVPSGSYFWAKTVASPV